MTLPIDELVQPLTEAQVLETLLNILEAYSIPARSWRVGGARRVILRAIARTYAGFTVLMAAAIRSQFLDWASGGWLTFLAYFVYGVTRIEATFATGQLQLTNSGGGIYSYGPDEVRFLNPTTKKAYRNTSAFTLNPGDVLLVDIAAVEVGSASSSAPNTITTLETTILGVTVTNPSALIGQDQEDDESLRQGCRDKLALLSPLGARGAYRYAVIRARRVDGTPVDINRVDIRPDPTTGIVNIYAASPSGTPTVADLDDARANIERPTNGALGGARPDTVTSILYGATAVGFSSTITVWATRTPGVAAEDIETLVLASLEKAIKKYPIGGIAKEGDPQGYLYGDYISGIAKSAHDSIFDIDGSDTDLALAAGQVATLAATVDVRIVEADA